MSRQLMPSLTDQRNRYTPVKTQEEIIDEQHKDADDRLLFNIARHIEAHYPGHAWKVGVSHREGIVRISIPLFMGSVNFYVIKISDLKTDPGLKGVTRACGEILERCGIARSGFRESELQSAVQRHPIRGTTYGSPNFDKG